MTIFRSEASYKTCEPEPRNIEHLFVKNKSVCFYVKVAFGLAVLLGGNALSYSSLMSAPLVLNRLAEVAFPVGRFHQSFLVVGMYQALQQDYNTFMHDAVCQ